jgi:hypothetical protein
LDMACACATSQAAVGASRPVNLPSDILPERRSANELSEPRSRISNQDTTRKTGVLDGLWRGLFPQTGEAERPADAPLKSFRARREYCAKSKLRRSRRHSRLSLTRRRRPTTIESIGSATRRPSLRGALATKQSGGRQYAAAGLLRFARNDGGGVGSRFWASPQSGPLPRERERGNSRLRDAQQLASRRDPLGSTLIAFRTKRSHLRFRRRPPADLAAPRPPTPQILETVSTRPALEMRQRTLSWMEGWLRSQGRGAPVEMATLGARRPRQVASLVFGVSFWRRPSRN